MFVFKCCRLSYLRVSWFRIIFTLVRHSFVSLIKNSFQENQHYCSRMCYCSNFSNEYYLIPFYFHLNQLRNFPAKTYRSGKKHIALSQRPGGGIRFFLDLPATNQRVSRPEMIQREIPTNNIGAEFLIISND